jgi:hypothetical protein
MKFLKSTIAAAAMVGTLAVTPARADFIFTSQCGGQSFSTCASGSLATSYDAGTGLTTVTINITHESTNGELFKAVGIIGAPAGSTIAFVSAPTGYQAPPPNDLSGGGLPDDTFGAVANSQSDMLGLGDSGTFVFTIQGELSADQIAALGVGVHAISGPNGCSNKYGVVDGTVIDNADPERYAECGETVIPEPITMTLLATGLAGMGGAGFLRRKKDEEIG